MESTIKTIQIQTPIHTKITPIDPIIPIAIKIIIQPIIHIITTINAIQIIQIQTTIDIIIMLIITIHITIPIHHTIIIIPITHTIIQIQTVIHIITQITPIIITTITAIETQIITPIETPIPIIHQQDHQIPITITITTQIIPGNLYIEMKQKSLWVARKIANGKTINY